MQHFLSIKFITILAWGYKILPSLFRSMQINFFEIFLFKIQNNKYFLHKTTFMKIFQRNGSFASFESTFEFPTKVFSTNFP